MTVKLKVLDLFSGIGGFSLGLERTGGFETVAFCEIDPFCQKVLKKHWPDVSIFEDIRNVGANEIRRLGRIDIVTGGFPCQDISISGKRAGLEGQSSGLWSEMLRVIRMAKPRWVLGENVASLTVRGLDRVLGDLADAGYDAEWSGLPAAAYGANHLRARQWVLAYPTELRLREQKDEICPGWDTAERCAWWSAEPGVRRVDDGVSGGMDRRRALGNAIVPQIPELIGRAILKSEAS